VNHPERKREAVSRGYIITDDGMIVNPNGKKLSGYHKNKYGVSQETIRGGVNMENTPAITCARTDCEIVFQRNTHNMKYCSAECCRIATNRRIMEKYYARRDQRNGMTRYCRTCQTTKLSRYNDGVDCNSCATKQQIQTNRSVINMMLAVNWQ